MTYTEPNLNRGRTGAKRQSWREDNPRSILLKLIAEHPHETNQDEDAILELLWQQVKDKEDVLRTICLYWGTNNYRSIVYAARLPSSRENVDKQKQKILIRLLDMKLASGKSLRDASKEDCLSNGGWLIAVGRKLKPGQKVGQVLSEKQLREMLESAQKAKK